MGFTDFVSDSGLTLLNTWLASRSYIVGYQASPADYTVFKSFQEKPKDELAAKFPHIVRWYKHIESFGPDFEGLTGDKNPASYYGPEIAEVTINPAKAPEKAPAADDDDDDVDLFGSDEEEEDPEKAAETARRLEEYRKKKAGKTKPAAKSIVTLEVKPWDDETDMAALEKSVRGIDKEGLVWGASQLIAVGFGIKKLQINLVVEDEKISLDELQEEIAEFEDYVQSSDIAAMQKL